jgi:hypothetical protein
MVTHQKALIANTDLASAQVFTFQLADYQLAVFLSGKADNVFLSIKQTMLELEADIKEFKGPVSALFIYLTQSLNKHISYLTEFELLLAAWTNDVLYLQRSGASDAPSSLPQAFLLRQDSIEPLPFSNQNQLVSGYIKTGDKIILANSGLMNLLQTNTNASEALSLLGNAPKDALQDVLSSLSVDQEHEPPVAILQLEVAAPPVATVSNEPSFSNPTPSRPKRGLPILTLPKKYRIILTVLALAIILPIIVFRLFFNSTPPSAPAIEPLPSPTALPSNVYQITDWPVLISLGLIKDDFAPTHLSFAESKLLLLDKNQKSLISFDLAQKNPTVLGGQKQLQDPLFASTNGEFAFSFSPSKGVVRLSISTQKDTLAAPKSPEWGDITDIVAFGSNFYLLDTGKSNIWKYVPTESGYSNPQSYFKEGVVTAFSDARKLQIDSSVWILKGLDELLKYTSGSQDFYGLSEFPENIKTITSFFVSADTENVYLLDSEQSAVFVTNKQGKFVSLYKGDKFKDAKDIFVDESTKTLFLVDSEKIYQIPLR